MGLVSMLFNFENYTVFSAVFFLGRIGGDIEKSIVVISFKFYNEKLGKCSNSI